MTGAEIRKGVNEGVRRKGARGRREIRKRREKRKIKENGGVKKKGKLGRAKKYIQIRKQKKGTREGD